MSFSRFGNSSCVTDVWSSYRITPIHWLMARRRLWRNHIVSLYWRTRHPLLRFLCLHEAVTLALRCCWFLDPTYLSAIIHCTSATASVELCSPRGEVPWSIAAVNRRARVSSLAKIHTVSALSAWGFRMHVTRFTGPRNAMSSSRRWRVSRQASPFLSLPLPSACARIHQLNSCMIFYFLARGHVIPFPSG